MRWLEMTGPEVARAGKEIGVALVPIGATERHGDHLPTGNDTLSVGRLCDDAAAVEPAVVLPTIFTGMNTELRHAPGSISIRPELIMEYLEELCDEIGRNGFWKIVIVSGHGGNRYMIPQLIMNTLDTPKPYVLYYSAGHGMDPEVREKVLETDIHAHACECETSTSLYLFPELVKMDRVPDEMVESSKPAGLEEIYSNVDWFASFPENVSGLPKVATAEKGRILYENQVKRLAKVIKTVKNDKDGPGLLEEFYRRVDEVSSS
ncbi:MAG: creatininase family protein [Planctomycetes bacterium]|nr:creatininase family protein [Planctomycetota bacterium]